MDAWVFPGYPVIQRTHDEEGSEGGLPSAPRMVHSAHRRAGFLNDRLCVARALVLADMPATKLHS